MKLSKEEFLKESVLCDYCGVPAGFAMDINGEAYCTNCGESLQEQVKALSEIWDRAHKKEED